MTDDKFYTWQQVLHWCETNTHIGYAEPLNTHATTFRVKVIFKNRKVKVQTLSGDRTYTLDHTHLDRFRK